jgi:phosphatidylinositol alpha-1,6-mannosyltransferase
MSRMYGELCRHLPPGSVEVAAPRTDDNTETDHGGVAVHRLPFDVRSSTNFINALRTFRWTRSRIAQGDIDVLQLGNFRPFGYMAHALRHRIPYVIYVHGLDMLKEQQRSRGSWRVRATARAIHGSASAFIANSNPIAAMTNEILNEHGIAALERIHVVHPGTDPSRFRHDPDDRLRVRAQLGIRDQRVLLSVGRLIRRKGFDVVLDALPGLIEEHPDLTYLIVGSGPDYERLVDIAARNGVSDRVHFLGEVKEDDLPGMYSAADIFVLAPREEKATNQIEGFGIVYCEAAAASLPVVAGASGGVPDAVRDGETGLLVDSTNVNEIRDALAACLRDAELRTRLGSAGRRAVEEYYNWRRAADQVSHILEAVAGNRLRS